MSDIDYLPSYEQMMDYRQGGKVDITDYGVLAKGRGELKKHYIRKRLTRQQAINAKCYDCCAGYTDGKRDCMLDDCPLHPYMPYKNQK